MGIRLTGISTPVGGVSWEYTKAEEHSAPLPLSPGQKIKVFISSICGVEKYDKVRAELKKAIWFYQVAFSLIFLPVCLCFVDSVVRTNLSASTAAQTFVCIDFVDITFRNRFYRTLANARTASHTVVINYVSHCF